jgi:hypothetical protein
MGGKYQHPWGALGCSTLQTGQTTLPYRKPGHKNTKTHNNQHEQAPPYPPAALAISLHGNIRHGPISWCRVASAPIAVVAVADSIITAANATAVNAADHAAVATPLAAVAGNNDGDAITMLKSVCNL